MESALAAVRAATAGTVFEGKLYLVGGIVRDQVLGRPESDDADLVTTENSIELAELLFKHGIADHAPVTYPRFGTAMVQVQGLRLEFVTARAESYSPDSRKPDVRPASLEADAYRRDFTANALMRNLHTGEMLDLTGRGLEDLQARILRTPLEPVTTFRDDPLRMLRAVRFRWQLGFEPAPGLYEAIQAEAHRLTVISAERIQEELMKMLSRPTAADALKDLMDLGLIATFGPELVGMVDVEQGKYHHLDVWNHTLLVIRNLPPGDPLLVMGALLHDVGKPPTRSIDEAGNTRFFGHDGIGADMTRDFMRRLKFSNEQIETVALLVKNHMRLGTSKNFTPTAARRLIRDMGPELDRLLNLVEADCGSLKPGVKAMDLSAIRERIAEVASATPIETLESPLSGDQIMVEYGLAPGKEVGAAKTFLIEKVLEGELQPKDVEAARHLLNGYFTEKRSAKN